MTADTGPGAGGSRPGQKWRTAAACVVLVLGILHFLVSMALMPLKTALPIFSRLVMVVVTIPAVLLAVRHLVKNGWLGPPDSQ